MTFETYEKWLKAHEKLIIFVLAGVLIFYLGGRGLNAWIDHDKRLADAATQKVQADSAANKILADQVEVLKQRIEQQDILINEAMAKRAEVTVKQKKVDDALPPTELAQRIQKLLNVGPMEVTSSPVSGELVFSNNAAHVNADVLEDLEQARSDVLDLKTQLSAERDLVSKQDEQVKGLQKELVDEKDSHAKDVTLERAKSKRSFFRGFKIGVIVGAVGGEVIRIFAFHKP